MTSRSDLIARLEHDESRLRGLNDICSGLGGKCQCEGCLHRQQRADTLREAIAALTPVMNGEEAELGELLQRAAQAILSDRNQAVAKLIADLQGRLDRAERTRDEAQKASNFYLQRARDAETKLSEARKVLRDTYATIDKLGPAIAILL